MEIGVFFSLKICEKGSFLKSLICPPFLSQVRVTGVGDWAGGRGHQAGRSRVQLGGSGKHVIRNRMDLGRR